MNGSPIDLTPFGSVLTGLGVLYWLVAAGALFAALRYPETCRGKWIAALVILVVFGYLPASEGWRAYQARSRLKDAMARFETRCKDAGEKVHRRVHGVDGIVWMKWRPVGLNRDQFELNDPYGKDCAGEGCIRQLLRPLNVSDYGDTWKQNMNGFHFVETTDPRDGNRYRYTSKIKTLDENTREEFNRSIDSTGYGAANGSFIALERQRIERYKAVFGVLWEDVSTREDRDFWIAGGGVKIMEIQTNSMLAERIGYLIDAGQGSTEGFRDPWGWAQSYGPHCPRTNEHLWEFATRILRPTAQGE